MQSMRILPTLLLVLIVLKLTAQQTVPDIRLFPSYEEMVNHFKSNYNTSFDHSIQVQFAKKPDGWYVELYNMVIPANKPQSSYLLWSYARKQFQQVPLMPNRKDYNPYWKPKEYEFYQEGFTIHPFFGYRGWSADVCRIYERLPGLNDSLLYAIGRAYSHRASIALWELDTYGIHSRYDTTFNKSDISYDSVLIFRDRVNQAIRYFKKTQDVNPMFITKVGNIHTKCSNEFLYAYLTLLVLGFETEAQSFITEGLYDDMILSAAENTLNSCPPNSLLITGGDLDTYSMTYLQALRNTRTDVVLANISLLNTGRYIHHLRYHKGVSLQISDQQYSILQQHAVILNDSIPFVSAEDVLAETATHTFSYEWDYLEAESRNIMFAFLETDSNHMNRLNTLIVEHTPNYLYTCDIFILDYIQNNFTNQPLCFSLACHESEIEPYKKDLVSLGLVYQLKTSSQREQADVILKNNKIRLLEKYIWNFKAKDIFLRDMLLGNYKYLFIQEAKSALTIKDTNTAILLIDKYIELFPDSIMTYGHYEATLMDLLIRTHHTNQLNDIASHLLDLVNVFITTKLNPNWLSVPDEHEVALWMYVTTTIKEISPEFLETGNRLRANEYYEKILPFYR